MKKVTLHIQGMTCMHCQTRIEHALARSPWISDIHVSYKKRTAVFSYEPSEISLSEIMASIHELGYKASVTNEIWKQILCDILITLTIIAVLQRSGLLNDLVPSALGEDGMSFWMLFAVGLMTSVHCIAMCGGFQLSQTLHVKNGHAGKQMFGNTVKYQCGRLISYSLIGGILGGLGSFAGLAQNIQHAYLFQGSLKFIAGILLVLMGINMLGWFPGFHFQFPERLKFPWKKTPFLIGLCNGLMPCGPLQAMQLVAIASGGFVQGMLSMFFFCLGTLPLLLGFGSFLASLGKRYTRQILHIGAIVVVVMGLAMTGQGMTLANIHLPSVKQELKSSSDYAAEKDGIQYVYSKLQSGKYPDIHVKAGQPVEWHISAEAGTINGCNNRIISADFAMEHDFEPGDNVIRFYPANPGVYHYTCWMGMISGKIYVEDS